ncbi:MAG: hypothetical protein HZA32_12730 [Opitutae bacterium]|nr:hypothetical protein [Opitutae bacterium]
MRFVFLATIVAALTVALRAGDVARTKPPPLGWPTESYATLAGRCRQADLAVFEFGAPKIFVTERAWLDAFDAALATDQAKPDARCFCASDYVLKLYSKNQLLCSVALTHDNKVRFTEGDYIVSAETHATLRQLWAIATKTTSYAPPRRSAQHAAPPRVELKP